MNQTIVIKPRFVSVINANGALSKWCNRAAGPPGLLTVLIELAFVRTKPYELRHLASVA